MKKILLTISIFLISISSVNAQKENNLIFNATVGKSDHHNQQWIVENIAQGSTIKNYLEIENLSNEKQQFKIEFFESKGNIENFKIIENQPHQNIANWIKLEKNEIEIPANKKQKINFTINIPDYTENQKYQGVILTTHTQKNQNELNIATRIGNRVYLNINQNHELKNDIFQIKTENWHIALIIIGTILISFGLIRKTINEK